LLRAKIDELEKMHHQADGTARSDEEKKQDVELDAASRAGRK
jgi:hypothetical protein